LRWPVEPMCVVGRKMRIEHRVEVPGQCQSGVARSYNSCPHVLCPVALARDPWPNRRSARCCVSPVHEPAIAGLGILDGRGKRILRCAGSRYECSCSPGDVAHQVTECVVTRYRISLEQVHYASSTIDLVWPRFRVWLMRQRIPSCSVRILRSAFGG